jgi:molecular chaperone GrpE
VLRPAMVGVAKGGPKAAATTESGSKPATDAAPAEPGPVNEQAEKDA